MAESQNLFLFFMLVLDGNLEVLDKLINVALSELLNLSILKETCDLLVVFEGLAAVLEQVL